MESDSVLKTVREGPLGLERKGKTLKMGTQPRKAMASKPFNWSRVWGRGCDEAEISEEKRSTFSLKEGQAFIEDVLVVC